MSKKTKRTDFLAGEFISENAVRGVFGGRRRRTPATTPTEPVNASPGTSPVARKDASSPARSPQPLRRWSVAELIARAVDADTADGMSHA